MTSVLVAVKCSMMLDGNNSLRLELDSELHHAFVQQTIQSFKMSDLNLAIVCRDGSVFSNKRYLGLYSAVLREAVREFPEHETVTLFVPQRKAAVLQMLDYFAAGELRSNDMAALEGVLELIQSLGVSVDDAEIIENAGRGGRVMEELKPKKRGRPKKADESISPSIQNLEIGKDAVIVEDWSDDLMEDVKPKKMGRPKKTEENITPMKNVNKLKKIKQKRAKIEPSDTSDETLLNESTEGQQAFETTASEEGSYNCMECDKKFESKYKLKVHSVLHTEKKFECQECGKRFATQGILTNHMGVHNPTKCDFCERTFAQKNSLKVHMQNVHPESQSQS